MTVNLAPRLALASILAATMASGPGCQEDKGGATRPSADGQRADQGFDEAMRIACDAPDQAEMPPESAGAANRAMVLAMWIDQRVHNQEVRQLMGGLAAQTPRGKIEALEAGARRAGIARCSLAEHWRAGAAPTGGARAAEASTPALPSEPQTYDEAIAILCDAPSRAALADTRTRPVDASAEVAAISRLVKSAITNRDVTDLFASLRGASAAERVRLLHQAAKKSGVPSCALAVRWDQRKP